MEISEVKENHMRLSSKFKRLELTLQESREHKREIDSLIKVCNDKALMDMSVELIDLAEINTLFQAVVALWGK
eukprot:8337633-Alexandrium_andersonii.AAC.1